MFAALDPVDGLAAKEVGTLTGLALSTVYKALKLLVAVGLATKPTGEWRRSASFEVQLDTIAEQLGTAGATGRQHQRHVDERNEYLAYFGYWKEIVDPETGVVSLVARLGRYRGRKGSSNASGYPTTAPTAVHRIPKAPSI